MPSEESIVRTVSEALNKLDIALSEALELSKKENDDLYQIGKLGRAIGLLREFQAPIFNKRHKLRSAPPWEGLPEPSLSTKEKESVSELSDEELRDIDNKLLSLANGQFQKVAKLVMIFMNQSGLHTMGIPDIFYGQRIEILVKANKLEYQGNLKFMQFCEVRVPKN